eukprot:m.5375 g.5375  ORF g.5375 m.5375 type:complete len:193 (-) comp2393_c0_seq1:268-846(-)
MSGDFSFVTEGEYFRGFHWLGGRFIHGYICVNNAYVGFKKNKSDVNCFVTFVLHSIKKIEVDNETRIVAFEFSNHFFTYEIRFPTHDARYAFLRAINSKEYDDRMVYFPKGKSNKNSIGVKGKMFSHEHTRQMDAQKPPAYTPTDVYKDSIDTTNQANSANAQNWQRNQGISEDNKSFKFHVTPSAPPLSPE